MFGCKLEPGQGLLVLALGFSVGCGGSVVQNDSHPVSEAGGGGAGLAAAIGGSRSAGAAGIGGRAVGKAGAGGIGPGPDCAPQEPPTAQNECDPFAANTCPEGQGCYPFVRHPEGDGCAQESYGTVCRPVGSGTQGMLCDGEAGCAPGFVCVVGQRAGKRCAALCDLTRGDQCSGGLICGSIDVAGFGACG